MKTNIGIVTTDEERQRIAEGLRLKHKLATRHDIKTFVNECIESLIRGETVDPPADPKVETDNLGGSEAGRDRSIREFVPSRGDEEYMFRAKDSTLKELHSNLLDAIQALEEYTWQKMEQNRA